MCGQHLCSILELYNNLSLCVSSVIVIMFANFTGAATVGQIFSSLIADHNGSESNELVLI